MAQRVEVKETPVKNDRTSEKPLPALFLPKKEPPKRVNISSGEDGGIIYEDDLEFMYG